MRRIVKENSAGIGLVFVFLGLVIIYLVLYGHTIEYTHTYFFVVEYIPPILNIDVLMMGTVFTLVLWSLVFGAVPSPSLFERIFHRKRFKKWLGVLGSAILVVALFALARLDTTRVPLLTASSWIAEFSFFLSLGSLGLIALSYAAFPKVVFPFRSKNVNLIYRVLALGMATVTTIIVISMIELHIKNPVDKQVLTPQSGEVASQSLATHYLFFTVNPHYRTLRANQSVPLELHFKALDPVTMQAGVSGAYPIVLEPSHDYAVSVDLRSIGFDVQGPKEELLEPRLLILDEIYKWQWIISPQEGKEGTKQTIIFDAYIHDLTTSSLIAESPHTTVTISVGTPLGLPTWLVSPQTGMGTIIGGFVVMIVPWMLDRLNEKKKEDDEEKKRRTPKIRIPDEEEIKKLG